MTLENLDPKWIELVENSKAKNNPADKIFEDKQWQTAFEQLAVYFVFRHTPDAVYENNFQVRLAFALLSTEFVIHLCSCRDEVSIASFADTARMYSSEIEYSEENIDELLFELENELI